MKRIHTFAITFHGTVDINDEKHETLEEVEEVVNNSFDLDLLAGVKLTGKSLHLQLADDQPSQVTGQ